MTASSTFTTWYGVETKSPCAGCGGLPPGIDTTLPALKRILKRGRNYERSISREYLEALNNAYDDFFFHYSAAPVFIVNTDNINFVDDVRDFGDLVSRIIVPRTGITFYNPEGH